ncbi:3-deoxy-manno-octulosonate cytidylyltransferase [Synechococcus sp. LTW-R]|uniref:3-deoxy-manno-octulosonate cytidylyltransferase n=1 Tax=Synechococcus sp. LTW-R TaxID=2751170 RepID=UPI001628EC2A|nr:3-deoxy-manno-octulosonate cytidylyltransferase [Synechococcus sp. LTW-R]QNG29102.1 3-deoxy-manno-octulosonate cytidylyltransferase [Synechococcus sp. LTW-R]
MNCLVAVPARLESSRLPNKVLADVGGKPMLQRVLERCAKANRPSAVVLCTDSDQLLQKAKIWGFEALLTSPSCASGSERIASVSEQLISQWGGSAKSSLIINVQGDQPFIDPRVIDAMADAFINRNPTPEVLTPVYRMSAKNIHNPNVVKTLLAADGRALYFSRSAIPHVRGVDPKHWGEYASYWGHVGIYGYRADVLQQWNDLPNSPLEQIEKLEQLRLIEAGIEIGTFQVEDESLSVDTAEQLEQARVIASAEL